MKIGIMTHHYVKNFGAYMQLKALLETVQILQPNATVEVIDYRVKKHEQMNALHFFGIRLVGGRTVLGLLSKIRLFFTHLRYENELLHSPTVHTAEDIDKMNYDLIIIGSDEVWNYNDIAYSPLKFGVGISTKHITYSASVGGSSEIEADLLNTIKDGINSFNAIAVRDEKTERFVLKMTDKKVQRTLDPVYLYDYELSVRDKIKKLAESKKYILIYDCGLEEEQVKQIVNFCKENNMNILGAGEYRNWYSTLLTTNITPYEWAYLFKHAWGVITGTFHGTSFSIKYNKQFVAYLTYQNRIDKVGSLLSEFGLEERRATVDTDIMQLMSKPIDYNVVNKILQEKKHESLSYIKNNIME